MPPRILSRIAREILNDHDEDASSIVPLTHVCGYWRQSIVSTPENWASISNRSNRGLAVESLERAELTPLEIYLGASPDDRWLSDLLAPYLNIETVNVHCISAIALKKFLPNFPQSVPNLQSLTLVTQQGSRWDRFADPFESFSPPLRYLKLSGVSLYRSLLKLRTLTELDLHDHQFNLHLDTLLYFLEENHLLESVTLEIIPTEPPHRSLRHRTPIKNRLQ